MIDTESRETARWAASITIQVGISLPDNYDLSVLLSNANNRAYYAKRLQTQTATLLSSLSNFDLTELPPNPLQQIDTAAQLIEFIAAHLQPRSDRHIFRAAASLPTRYYEPDDTVGAL